ncbi:polysaccharide pyruvyl transferase family protein [Jannaschia rubra]|uniref:Polysaccharide pyruvyl transferase n=1 Tax=Jannaschia rubra TaxID=282197 RepID=A0A0M6XLW3_9RHOB|nr:polysaccharide pyruvyl transferase family protein [Jannaschia rubra]CTQ31918.1 Polysaccharide pyruvyl transferase [Jannaschia rubra]SFG78761.1 Polysaccharide pyruvyl transferase [Jannaschia rubra]
MDLGIDWPAIYGDPALLMPLLFPMERRARYDVGIVPHLVDAAEVPPSLSQMPGACVIDVTAPPLEVARRIADCRRIVSTSLHGIIIAHAYGIPATRLILSGRIRGHGVKYRDYIEAFGETSGLPTIDARQVAQDDLPDAPMATDAVPGIRAEQRGLVLSCPSATEPVQERMLRII